jgi:hypothetical protein
MRKVALTAAVALAGIVGVSTAVLAGDPPFSRAYLERKAMNDRLHARRPVPPRSGRSFYRGPYGQVITRDQLPPGGYGRGYTYIGGYDRYSRSPQLPRRK